MSTKQYPQLREAPKKKVKPGTVGVISSDLSRYSIFSMCLINLLSYSGDLISHFDWLTGSNITGNSNELCRRMMAETGEDRPKSDWLWIIGDDHAFRPDILERLVLHDVDAVAPLCLQRSSPYPHVVYEGEDYTAEEEGTHVLHTSLPSSGLTEVYACGNAGLLVKRHVFEAIGDPYYETFGRQNEDLEFCRKIRDAGFKIHVDTDALLGHIGNMIVWPQWTDEHGWGVRLNTGPEHNVYLQRFDKTNSLVPV
jgi:hypothetical protein